jgi:hypothetical protein
VRLHAQRGDADQQSGEDGDHQGQRGGRPKAESVMGGEDRGRIGAYPEEGDLGQVDLPGDPHGQAHADGQQGEHQRDVDHVDGVATDLVRQDPGEGDERGDPADSRCGAAPEHGVHARLTVISPNRPSGRTMMIRVKTRKTTSSE